MRWGVVAGIFAPADASFPGMGQKPIPRSPTFDGIRPPSSKESTIALQSVVRRAAESPQLRRPFPFMERRTAPRLA